MMRPNWRSVARWLVVLFAVVIVLVFVRRQADLRNERETSKSTGLGALDNDKSSGSFAKIASGLKGSMGGTLGGVQRVAAFIAPPNSEEESAKVVRVAKLVLQVRDTTASVAALKRMAGELHGQIDHVSQQQTDSSGSQTAELALRVPAEGLDAALAQFKTIAIKVISETVDVRDVTREWVDQGARLRNLRAAEQQYLQILRTAKTIKDTLEVTEKLNDVRGEIEKMEAERRALAHDVEMSSVEINLTQDPIERVQGIQWRPWLNAKRAARDSLAGMADWADSIVAFLLQLPVIALWLATILFLFVAGWRILRWFFRTFFPDWRLPWQKKTAEQIT